LIRTGKSDYNREIKEYNTITKTILNEEKSLEDIEKKISNIRYKQKMTLNVINVDFVKHFNDYANRINPEIVESIVEFFGFVATPYNLIKVITYIYE
jgi:hypothetical protein